MYCAILQVAWKINSNPLCRCILQPPPTRGRGCSGQTLREDKLNIEQIIFKQCFGSGSTSIPAPDPDPDPDPLRFLASDPDPDPLKKALIWIRVAPNYFRVKSKTKCFCYLRNAFSKFWR